MTNDTTSSTRSDFLSALQSRNTFGAIRAARTLMADESGLRQVSFIARELGKIAPDQLELKPLKIALLSSFSVEFLRQPLLVKSFLNGISAQIYLPGFGQFQQEIRNPASGLYDFSPDVVILAVEGMDWLPQIYRNYLDNVEKGFETTLDTFREEMQSLIHTFRERSSATLLVNNFVPPVWRQLGILDGHVSVGQAQLVHRVNDSLAELCQHNPGVFMVDYAGLVNRHGALRWYDERMNHYAKAPIAMEMLRHLAAEYVKFLRAVTGQTKKCLVVDLDNTLWGGILGEEGLAGIQIGPVYPGSAYQAFQREILNLYKRGVLLAIASKNNSADVDEVFAKHEGMLLKREHFSARQIHWEPKSESLREIARQLNIGLEHIVFADDNPAECEEVRRSLPMVATLLLPKQPELYVRALLEDGLFDGISFSLEDRRRGELYRQREQSELLRSQSGSMEEFYRSLEMEVLFAPVDISSLARSAQLTQKTNQFNVTTIRFSEADLLERMNNPDWLLTTVSVRDRFGDNGIVGLTMAHFTPDAVEIETFLLSCRVIGRGVETSMLSLLCEQAIQRGTTRIKGRIMPTAKNMPVRELFEKHEFTKLSETEFGETLWSMDLTASTVPWPGWMKYISNGAAAQRT
jgi:FkbH-like protein